jgi:hypothetical protein
VIAGPTLSWLDLEIEALTRYFDRGGSIFVLLEPDYPDGTPKALLEHLGVDFDSSLLANENKRNHLPETRTEADRTYLWTNKFTSHSSVTTISRHREQVVVILPRTGSVAKKDGTKLNVQLVVNPMPGTFRDANGNFKKDAGDAKEALAPEKFAIAAAVEGDKVGDKTPKAVVVGSTELISDKWISVPLAGVGNGNGAFTADAVKWLVGDEKYQAPVAISEEDVPIKHTRRQDTIWFYATVFLAPAMVLAGGLGFVHRSRQGGRKRGGAQ